MVSAHATSLEGYVTEGLIAYVGAQARTGASIVTIGSTPVDYDRARDFYGSLSVINDTDVPDLMLLAEAVHRYGAKISVELVHAGRIAHSEFLHGKPKFVPSLMPNLDSGQAVKEISPAEMKDVIRNYVACVRRLKRAGFDMVMVHAAHGNLVSSFLSPYFNRRTDAYGGSLEKRMRFPLELLKAVREEAGDKLNIELRICGNEYIEGSPTLEEVTAFIQEAEKYIDMVIVSGGLLFIPEYSVYTMPPYYMPHMLNVPSAAEIKKHVSIPVSVVGNITSIEEAEDILASGKADIVAMARNLIADQDFVTKAYRGQSKEIRPCLRCLNCTNYTREGSPVRCSVNPQAGRELYYRFIPKADKKKKVMVIGGGAGGMMAAQTAVKRGHEVVLYEQSDKLGGKLYAAGAMLCKDGFRKYIDWDIKTTMECGSRIIFNTAVTPEIIEAENPDAVIIAIGAEEIRPSIPGIDLPHVVSVENADLKVAEIGDNVVVCGGGLSGMECAVELAKSGKKVTVVDLKTKDDLWNIRNVRIKVGLLGFIDKLNIGTYYGAKISKITHNQVEIVQNNTEIQIAADTVVLALGFKPNFEANNRLSAIIPETYLVGDCSQVGDIGSANMSAFNIAVEI